MTRTLRMSEAEFAARRKPRSPIKKIIRKVLRDEIPLEVLGIDQLGQPKDKPSKYHNKIIVALEGRFHSKKEYERFCKLREDEKRGLISDLRRQVPFILAPGYKASTGRRVPALRYFADAVYQVGVRTVVEDTKGFRDRIYKIKKHLMFTVHNIEILEV